MKLFADENIPAQIVDQLRQLGHDVLYPPETGLSAEDACPGGRRGQRVVLFH